MDEVKKFNKKYVIRAIIIVIIILGLACFFYRIPKEFRKEYQGVYYQLGNPEFSEKVKVSFDGYLTRGLWQMDDFEGSIRIGDRELTMVRLRLSDDYSAAISYTNKETHDVETCGTLYTKDIKKGFTICVFKKDENNPGHSSWYGQDGYMISAPASNRSEALELSNRLMEKSLLEDLK